MEKFSEIPKLTVRATGIAPELKIIPPYIIRYPALGGLPAKEMKFAGTNTKYYYLENGELKMSETPISATVTINDATKS